MQSNEIHALLCGASSLVVFFCLISVLVLSKSYSIKGRRTFVTLLWSFIVGNVFNIIQLLSEDVEISMIAFQAQTFLTILTTVCFVLLFRYNLPNYQRMKGLQISLCLITAIGSSVLIFTNPGGTFYREYWMAPIIDGTLQLQIDFGLLFYLFQCILYGLFMFCMVRVIVSCAKRQILFKQALYMVTPVVILIFANVFYVLEITPYDYTNILVFVLGFLLFYCLMNYGIMDTTPFVRRNMFTLLRDPFLVVLPGGRIEHLNRGAEKLLGRSLGEIRGKTLHQVNPAFPEAIDADFLEVELEAEPPLIVQMNFTLLADKRNRQFGRLIMMRDITKQYLDNRQLEYLASFDKITGLINADTFLKVIERYHEGAPEGLYGTYIFAAALDNAPFLRGIASKKQKDKLYLDIAKYIQRILGNGFLISRFGEDEFYIFSNGVDVGIMEFCSEFERTKHAVFTVDGQHFSASFRMGIYGAENSKITPAEAIDRAAFALRSVLSKNRSLEIYDFIMAQQHELYKKLVTSITNIDYVGEFFLEFQPIVDITAGRVAAAEALLRWTHPIYGNLSPAVFIPIFESANEMYHLGYVILEKACAALASWQAFVSPDFKLSINISKRQIDDPALIPDIKKIIAQYGVDPTMLDFEITETSTSGNVSNVVQFCRAVHEMGASISMDDFGSGDTSIAYITDMGINKLKLDISLSDNSHIDEQRGVVVKSLLNMCNSLNIAVVVEHVENIDALLSLKNQGFALIQGYIFSRSLPQKQFLQYYESFRMDRFF